MEVAGSRLKALWLVFNTDSFLILNTYSFPVFNHTSICVQYRGETGQRLLVANVVPLSRDHTVKCFSFKKKGLLAKKMNENVTCGGKHDTSNGDLRPGNVLHNFVIVNEFVIA